MEEYEFLEDPSTVGITGSIGGVRILGFDIQINESSSVWLELQDGLNVLYGKNGAGKSTILDAIRRFCSRAEHSLPSEKVDLYLQVDNYSLLRDSTLGLLGWDGKIQDFQRGLHLIDRTLDGSPLPNEGKRRRWQRSPRTLFNDAFGSPSEPSLDSTTEQLATLLDNVDPEQQVALQKEIESLAAAIGVASPKAAKFFAAIALTSLRDPSCPVTDGYNHGWPNWYLAYIKHSLASALFLGEPMLSYEFKCDWRREWEPVDLLSKDPLPEDFALEGLDLEDLTDRSVPELFSELFLFFIACHPNLIKVPEGTDWESVKSDMSEFFKSGVLRISKSDRSSWFISPAIRKEVLPESLKNIELLEALANKGRPRITTGFSAEDRYVWLGVESYEDDLWQPEIRHLPFLLVDADQDLEPLSFFTADILNGNWRWLDEIDDDFLRSFQSELDRLSEGVSRQFSELEVAVEKVRATVSRRVDAWFAGTPVTIEYLDAHLRKWLPIDKASSAQQRWIRLAIHLYQASEYRAPVLITADEPDTGLHVTAGPSISKVFRNTGQTALISSHSPGVIRDPFLNLFHVRRGVLGECLVEKVEVSDDPLAASTSLGVDAIDLLPRLKVAVFVEGEHDSAAITEYLSWLEKGTGDHRPRQLSKLIPSRGVGLMPNVVDAQILIDYTDAHLLIIADNFGSGRFTTIIEDLLAKQRAGCTESELLSELMRSKKSKSNSRPDRRTFEERTMFDVLSVAIRKRCLERVTILGIDSRDITELFPPSAFNLADLMTWDDLRHQFDDERKLTSTPNDFKKWLEAKHKIKITARRVASATRESCESAEGPPQSLRRIGDAISLHTST